MVTVVVIETVGAVNKPLPLTDPAVAAQLAAEEAENCSAWPEAMVPDVGETVKVTGGGAGAASGVTEMLACAVKEESAALMAVTVTGVVLKTVGAVNSPALVMEPPLAVQLAAPDAVNCKVCAETTLPEVGETVSVGATVVLANAAISVLCSTRLYTRTSSRLPVKYVPYGIHPFTPMRNTPPDAPPTKFRFCSELACPSEKKVTPCPSVRIAAT